MGFLNYEFDKRLKDGKLVLIIKGDYYDVTEFKNKHPGGVEILEKYKGQDASKQFEQFRHGPKAQEIMKKYKFQPSIWTKKQIQELETENIILVLDHNLYDLTEFVNNHPGGAEILRMHKKEDVSGVFRKIGHSKQAWQELQKYQIGRVKQEDKSQKKWLYFMNVDYVYLQVIQMKQEDYSECLFNCKLKKKKLIGKQSRYLYAFQERIIINKDLQKGKGNRVIPYGSIKRVVWNYAKHKKNQQIYLKSFTIILLQEEVKYYGEEDILQALKRILAKFVFQGKVQDEYDARQVLGEGSYATVMRLQHLHSNLVFAGKCIEKKKLDKIDHGIRSVQNEISIMRALSPHSQIVNLHEVYDGDLNIYLVMDYCEGSSLQAEIKQRVFNSNQIKEIMYYLLSAIEYLHSKDVMHRDLKPDNILFQKSHDYSTLKIADFGLSAFSKQIPYLYPKCGTPGYVAPEVANLVDKSSGYDVVCDIFSAGVIFHLLLMGEGVFPGKGHIELLKKNKECHIDQTLQKYEVLNQVAKDLLFLMLQPNPKHRPTASKCLEHSYFSEQTLAENPVQHYDQDTQQPKSQLSLGSFKQSDIQQQ